MHARELRHAARHTDLESRMEKKRGPASQGDDTITAAHAGLSGSEMRLKLLGPITDTFRQCRSHQLFDQVDLR